jgi:hypothetical protein
VFGAKRLSVVRVSEKQNNKAKIAGEGESGHTVFPVKIRSRSVIWKYRNVGHVTVRLQRIGASNEVLGCSTTGV